ncbi:hypothetical protein OROMI_008269 [Orobanche minor]
MHEGSNKSYRDAFSREDDDTRLGSLDFSDLNPTAVFTKEECADVSEYYKFALIGKFTYGKPSNQVISQQLKSDSVGLCKVQFLNGKHVLINLTCKSLCDKLWMKREYIVSGFPMRLFLWSPSFDFKHEPALVPVWFKVHSLPAQWFDVRSLQTIASLVGTLVKIDDCTRNRTRMNFARLCVVINLEEHRNEKINLSVDGVKTSYDLEFEKIPKYCHHCKHIGHDIDACYFKNPALNPEVFTQKKISGKNVVDKMDTIPKQKNIENNDFELVGKRGRVSNAMNTGIGSGAVIPHANKFQLLDDSDTTESDCLIIGPLCVDKTDNDPFSAGFLCSENQEPVQGQGNVPDLADENQDLCNQGSCDDLSSESNDDFDF